MDVLAEHVFEGEWITNGEFCALKPVNVFHRQLEKTDIPECGHSDRHILFRKTFTLEKAPSAAYIYITADDYFKLWINGKFVVQGPAPAYRFRYGYIAADVTAFLRAGRNVIAVHTLYQGLINRVWVSGDMCHGLLFDLIADGRCAAKSDENVLAAVHGGFTPLHTVGYATQFMEKYDSRSDKVGFEHPDYDDGAWEAARARKFVDYTTVRQQTAALVFEEIRPVRTVRSGASVIADFGSTYVGTLCARARGRAGDEIVLRFAQELNGDGSIRYRLRANCEYEERWVLSGGEDTLDQFDGKSFRYAELILPEGCEVWGISLSARHYPFKRLRGIRPEYADDPRLNSVFGLCSHTLEYGVQEVIQDCMEREKGFYVGDGCYSALAHMILTGDDLIVRKLICDAFSSAFITDTLVTCLDCSLMQEIAEYPLMLISLILWHYRIKGDGEFLRENYKNVCALLDAYKKHYERDGLLQNLDKWCVVEWPDSFRDGYDVDIEQGKICREAHIAINAYYVEAVKTANKLAAILALAPYRDEKPLVSACRRAFFDPGDGLFRDGVGTHHKSYIGNVLALYAGLFTEAEKPRMYRFIGEKGITGVELFGSFPLLASLIRDGRADTVREMLADENAWLRIIREGGTTTFEGWGKDTKWNTSLFHLTLSLAAVFLADIDTGALFA